MTGWSHASSPAPHRRGRRRHRGPDRRPRPGRDGPRGDRARGVARVGGKLLIGEVAGVGVDLGAESMLARRPEGVDLAQALGLDVVHPATTSSSVWTRGALRPMPRSVMGVPADVEQVAAPGVLSDAGVDRLRHETSGRPVADGEDVSVGELVATRLGDEVVDRLVEPLLGGVYAGHARLLSARATAPQLVVWSGGSSLVEAATHALTAVVRAGLRGAWRVASAGFPPALGRRARRPHRRARARAAPYADRLRARRRPDHGRRGGARRRGGAGHSRRADRAPAGGRRAGRRGRAGCRRATPRWPSSPWPSAPPSPRPAGLRLPRTSGRRPHDQGLDLLLRQVGLGPRGRRARGLLLLRTSVGRHREEHVLQVPDDELVAASLADLADATGLAAPAGRHPRAALGRRSPAVRRRPPRPGGSDPCRRGAGPGPGRLRGGVRRRRHPRRHRLGPPGRGRSRRRQNEGHDPRRPHPRDQRHHPLHDVVGVPARDALRHRSGQRIGA